MIDLFVTAALVAAERPARVGRTSEFRTGQDGWD